MACAPCMWGWGVERPASRVIPQVPSALFFWGWLATCWFSESGLWAPRTLLCLLPQLWDYRGFAPCPAFYIGVSDRTQFLVLAWQALCQLSLIPGFYRFFKCFKNKEKQLKLAHIWPEAKENCPVYPTTLWGVTVIVLASHSQLATEMGINSAPLHSMPAFSGNGTCLLFRASIQVICSLKCSMDLLNQEKSREGEV